MTLPSPSKQAQKRALLHLRLVRDHFPTMTPEQMRDRAEVDMYYEGYDPIVAEQAVARMWREHFETQPPI